MYQLENDRLRIRIDAKGAELKSVYSKPFALEYMWGADPAFWGKTSPVLFPIVGALKDNAYHYKGRSYQLSRHGFARDKEFAVTAQTANSITFTIESDESTLAIYPFLFCFSIIYTLRDDELTVGYLVHNSGEEPLYFSVGGHPAFKVPLVAGTGYSDYQLRFEKEETADRWLISNGGLIANETQPLLQQASVLPLSKELFSKDAIVLKHLQSKWVQLQSDKTPHGLRFSFPQFPFLGLWAAPGADFLCIEPWCGIADSVAANQQLPDKEGIVHLAPAADYNVRWGVQFY